MTTDHHQTAANNEDEDESRPRRLSFEADANGMATLANQSEETTAISIQKKRKLSIPGTTTARQAKKPLSQTKIKINCRVFTRKSEIKFLVSSDEQRQTLRNFKDNYRLYGTVISGGSNKGYSVEFDIFPVNMKKVHMARRRLTVVKDGEEEVLDDNTAKDLSQLNSEDEINNQNKTTSTRNSSKGKKSRYQSSIDRFVKVEKEVLCEAVVFDMDLNDNCTIKWNILADNQHITKEEDPMEYPSDLEVNEAIDFDDKSLADIWFDHFLPSVKGHALRIDEFLSDPRAPYYSTATNQNIKFYQHVNNSDEDPDWVVKQCYLLLIAAVTEADVGVENLWKFGESGGRREYANFGKYIPINYFKTFLSCAPYMFCDKKYWYEPYEEKGWEIFQPVINSFNLRRRNLFSVSMLMLDESMSGWRPKTSKLGGLPNITYEPRKPVPLGTQFKNGVECFTGVLAYQDPVVAPEKQKEGFLLSKQ
jgi:hypothetical protein